MNTGKESNLNISVKIPEALKTDTERIVWIGDNIRTRLVTIEALNKQKAKAKEEINVYEELVRAVIREKEDER